MNDRDKLINDLLTVSGEYIDLLTAELMETIQIASVHGWKSSRYLQGVKIRARIIELRSKIEGGQGKC